MFVFHVDAGRMYRLAVAADETVAALKVRLQEETSRIPPAEGDSAAPWTITVARQILLDGQGSPLNPEELLLTYSTGTEDNPMFVYNVAAIKSPAAAKLYIALCRPPPIQPLALLADLVAGLEVHARLATDYRQSADEHAACFQRLTREIRLQIQGCNAAVTNLVYHARKLEKQYLEYMKMYQQLSTTASPALASTDAVVRALQGVSVHPALVPQSLRASLPTPQGPSLADCLQSTGFLSIEALLKASTDARRILQQLEPAAEKLHKAVTEVIDGVQRERTELPADLNSLTQTMTADLEEQRSAIEIVRTQCARARESTADRNILGQYMDHHVQMSHALQERDQRLRRTCQTLAEIKQLLAPDVLAKLQAVISCQQRIKQCRSEHPFKAYTEAARRVDAVAQNLKRAARIPQAYLGAMREIVRRRPFASKYQQMVSRCSERVMTARQAEIEKRGQFEARQRHFLPPWPAFEGLNDYPHSCVKPFRVFDDRLPDISRGELVEAEQEIRGRLGDPALAQLILPWESQLTDVASESSTDDADSLGSGAASDRVQALQEQIVALHYECGQLQGECDRLRSQQSASVSPDALHEATARATAAEETARRLEEKNCELLQRVSKGERLAYEREAEIIDLKQLLEEAEAARLAAASTRPERASPVPNQAPAARASSSVGVQTPEPEPEPAAEAAAGAEPGVPRLAFTQFEEGDIALFLRWRRDGNYVTFNRGAPFRILSAASLDTPGMDRNAKYIVGRITRVTECTTTAAREYNFEEGQVYYSVDAEAFVLPPQAAAAQAANPASSIGGLAFSSTDSAPPVSSPATTPDASLSS